MSANQNLDFQLLKSLASSGQAGLAKYGGYGNNSGFGNFLNIAAQGLAGALPGTPLAGLLSGVNSAVNVGKYNKYQQQLAEQARQYETAMNAAKANDRRTYVQNGLGLNVSGYGDAPDSSMIGAIQQANQNPNIDANLQGKPLRQAQYGAYNSDMVQNNLNRTAAVNDAGAMSQQMGGIFGDGQNAGRGFLGGKIGNALTQQILSLPPLDTGEPSLSAGVSEQYSPPPTRSPYATGIVSPENQRMLFLGGSGNAEELNKQAETHRSNTVNENETAKNHRATERIGQTNAQAHMISAKKPSGGGGSQNPYTIPNAQQNYVQGQIKAIDTELKTLGFMDKGVIKPITPNSPAGMFGLGGHTQSPNEQRAKQLIEMRSQLQGQILPFGGQAKQNLKNSASGFAAWKSGKK